MWSSSFRDKPHHYKPTIITDTKGWIIVEFNPTVGKVVTSSYLLIFWRRFMKVVWKTIGRLPFAWIAKRRVVFISFRLAGGDYIRNTTLVERYQSRNGVT